MSRIGKAPIKVPAGVTVSVSNDGEGNKVSVKGPKGELSQSFRPEMRIKHEEGHLHIERKEEMDGRISRGLHGLTRTLINNMVVGVSQGFERKMEVIGVGYRAVVEGRKLNMALGYSHPVEIDIPKGIEVAVGKGNVITITGFDKQALGDFCADVRSRRPPEVYKGKGVKYAEEVIRKKAGKAAGSK